MAIYVDEGAELVLDDTTGNGEIVSSCYGVYVKQNGKFIMNGGTITVTGNGTFDYGVCLWNAEFVMNGGTINSNVAVWASNYYRDNGQTGLNNCAVTIEDGCVLNSLAEDINVSDAPDTELDLVLAGVVVQE